MEHIAEIPNAAHSEKVTEKLYENLKSVSEPQEKLAEVDKIRIMQANAHALSLKKSIDEEDFEDSDEEDENHEVSIRNQDISSEVTLKTSRPCLNLRHKQFDLQTPHPKRLREHTVPAAEMRGC